MEFDFTSLSFGGADHVQCWDAKRITALRPDDQELLRQMLDTFGKKSAVAQGLGAPVTDIYRLRSTDQRLYLHMYRQTNKTVILGGLKVGTKRLYVRTLTADLLEIEPVCVLDFYVHESMQRQGVGKHLFEHFLTTEGLDPGCLAYDRPSPKLLGFLKKHYGLYEYVPQSNNYVVFSRYFDLNPLGSRAGGGQGRIAASRGSISSLGTPMGHIHPLHGPRSTPPPLAAPPAVHPSWGAGGMPASVGQSPSFGARWAANNFGSGGVTGSAAAPPYPATSYSQEDGGMGSTAGGGGGSTVGSGSGGGGAGFSGGDSLDAFTRHNTQSSQPQYHSPPRGPVAPWDAPGPSGPPPGSRQGYTSRPPWAVDDAPGPFPGHSTGSGSGGYGTGSSGRGGAPPPMPTYAAGSPSRATPPDHNYHRAGGLGGNPSRTPLQSILSGGAHGPHALGASAAGPGAGPHMRALQQQVAAMQVQSPGSGPMGGGYGGGPGPGYATPGAGAGSGPLAPEEPAGAGRGAAKIAALAQRSGAGAADCLVW
ncbi:hypothetical protein HYH03_009757 [Edaphochlamys debaryana]|uniref:Alpha-tubulin N-acetyltransferase n=1 Tax=Edaphochlamys debaryana TaxID=47281 RepID=A0A836BY83_9CHLO|nr:hypothetical protein HYH03_009757 [Edaphochlamys debaryana]|eukprot:KAG2492028.1 hypothetical protein HYH03_009757 [Edaphochlamys debaryana]